MDIRKLQCNLLSHNDINKITTKIRPELFSLFLAVRKKKKPVAITFSSDLINT